MVSVSPEFRRVLVQFPSRVRDLAGHLLDGLYRWPIKKTAFGQHFITMTKSGLPVLIIILLV